MIEINLIPDVKQELLRAQKGRAVVISASIFASVIAVGVVALLLVYIFGVQGVRKAGRRGVRRGYGIGERRRRCPIF